MKRDLLAGVHCKAFMGLVWLSIAWSPQALAQAPVQSGGVVGLPSDSPSHDNTANATLDHPSPIDREMDRNAAEASATLPLIPSGLLKSRWAMSDPQYAKKYAKGASKINLPQKIKQAADARFVDDFSGWYLSAGLTAIGDTPAPLGSIELGCTGYQTSYLTNRVGFIAAVNDEDFYIGGETGIRLQTPTRLAPFVGVGLFAGASSTRSPAEHDNVDNDDDGAVDEDGETEFDFDGVLAAVYPEVGLHFWWTPRVRLSGFGRFMVTTEGRRADSSYFGATIAILSR